MKSIIEYYIEQNKTSYDKEQKRFPKEAYIKPNQKEYDPNKSHYDKDGDWVGDVTATEASEYWKKRALDFKNKG